MAVVALLLLACAGAQWNDPDPIRWIAFYTGSAVSVLGLRYMTGSIHTGSRWAAMLLIAIAVLSIGVLAIAHFDDLESLRLAQAVDGMNNAVPGIELAKEIGGLLLTGCALGAAVRRHGQRAAPHP